MNRKNNIGLLHFLAATGVMLGHQYVLQGGTAPGIFGMDVHSLSLRVIFAIMGYLITESWYNTGSTIKYIGKRIKRIYPAYILSIVLSIVVLGIAFSSLPFFQYLGHAKSYFFQNLLLSPKFDLPGVFLDNVFPNSVNGALWTLPIEMLSYFLIIPIMKLCDVLGKYGNALLAGIVIVLWVVCYMQSTGMVTGRFVVWGTEWFGTLQIMQYFWAGSLFSRAKLKKYCNLQLAVVFCAFCQLMYGSTREMFYLPVITYITLSLAFAEKPVFSKFQGKLSYEIYLYGFPIQQSLIQLIIVRGGQMQFAMPMFALSFTITLLVAFLTNKFIESIMTGKLHDKIKKFVNMEKMKEIVKSVGEQIQEGTESEETDSDDAEIEPESEWELLDIDEIDLDEEN